MEIILAVPINMDITTADTQKYPYELLVIVPAVLEGKPAFSKYVAAAINPAGPNKTLPILIWPLVIQYEILNEQPVFVNV